MTQKLAALVVVLGLAPLAGAQLIGDTVLISYQWPSLGTYFDGPYAKVVAAGNLDAQVISCFADHHPGLTVNVEADRILVDFLDSVTFNAPSTMHGMMVENLDNPLDPSWVVTAANFAPDSTNLGVIGFNAHAVWINFFGNSTGVGTHLDIRFAPTPGSATVLLAAGAIASRRRRPANSGR